MILQDIFDAARSDLDDTTPPYLWSDADLLRCANWAINTMARDARLFIDSRTAAICQIPVLALDVAPDYLLDTRILEILNLQVSTQAMSMTRRSRQYMDEFYPNWHSATKSTPYIYLLDYSDGYLTIHPGSNVNATISMTVLRLPSSQMALTAMTASPEIPFEFHPHLLDGIKSQAYLKEDSQTLDPQKAREHLGLFRLSVADASRRTRNLRHYDNTMRPHGGAL